MARSFDPGALLGRSYPLQDGTRIRLRLARAGDGPAIRALIEAERAAAPGQLEAARLIHFDPHERCVLAAMALIDGHETLVGLGSISLSTGDTPRPELVLVDHRAGPGLRELVEAALIGRAQAIAEARAA